MTEQNEKEIREYLRKAIERKMSESDEAYYALYGFLLKKFFYNVGSDSELVEQLVNRLVNANIAVCRTFVETFFEDDDDFNLKLCDTCGEWMLEGYYLAGDYACCEDCAIQNYMNSSYNHSDDGKVTREKAEELFRKDLDLDEQYNLGQVYYTDWR